MDFTALALTFGAIFVVELPDKTFLATLVLATKYRPILVWIGVGLAFAVQTTVAVLLGHAASFLPEEVVQSVALLMFTVGAVVLLRQGLNHHRASLAEGEEEYGADAKPATGFRAVLASFLILFAAEWGDLSQLLTAGLAARYHDPVSVFVGSLLALVTVAGLAVILGRTLLRFVRLSTIRRVGAVMCLVLACLAAYDVIRSL
jgi:putative Ca2+/H+ antiporter (TMEM165/GDT1 family)